MVAVAVVGLLALALPSTAGAKAVDRFFPEVGASGGGGGQFLNPRGIAIRASTGQLFVVDTGNHRIQRLAANGAFERAWGVDVVDGVANPGATGDTGTGSAAGFEVCVVAAHCKAGLSGAGNAADAARNGQLASPQGIAVSQTTGDVYVWDRNNLRVNQYSADGAFIRSWGWDVIAAASPGNVGTAFEVCAATDICKIGLAGAGDGQLGAGTNANYDGTGVAVDPASGDVFVVDPGAAANRRVQRFQAGGGFVGKFGAAGAGTGLFGTTSSLQVQPLHVAVGDGIVYASDCENNVHVVERYDLDTASFLAPIEVVASTCASAAQKNTALAIDPVSGNLLVGRPGAEGILEFDVSGEPAALVATHLAGAGLVPNGLAVRGGDVFFTAVASGTHRVYVADDDGASGALDVTLSPPTAVTASTASFSGTVDPGGFPVTYRFEYSRNGTSWTRVAAPLDLGNGTEPVAVPVGSEGSATGLAACTVYRVRIAAVRGYGNGEVFSPELSFATDCVPPDVATGGVASRDEESAFLPGTVNPNGTDTAYWFEYGPTESYGSIAPAPSGSAGAGTAQVDLSQRVAGLEPDRRYHYRLCAANSEGEACGDGLTFTTLARPAADSGPVRRYELVSPADKVGGVGVGSWYKDVGSLSQAGAAAHVGERFGSRGVLGSVLVDGPMAWAHDLALAERTPAGWVNRSAMTLPTTGNPAYRMLTLQSATPDLRRVSVKSNGGVLRMFAELADWVDGDPTFMRDWDGGWELAGPRAENQIAGVTGFGNVVHKTVAPTFSADGRTALGVGPVRGLAGAGDPTADQVAGLSSYVLDLPSAFTNTFAGATTRSPLGVCAGGTELPAIDDGVLTAAPCPSPESDRDSFLISDHGASPGMGTNLQPATGRNVVSSDGARMFFMSPDPNVASAMAPGCTGTVAATACPAQLYVRQRATDGTVTTRWISRAEDGLLGSQVPSLAGPAIFEGASADGSRVFFRTNAPLTADDPNGACGAPCTTGSPSDNSWDLYMYELPGGSDGNPATPDGDPGGGTLTRVSRGPSGTADANGVTGAVGTGMLRYASDDGGRLYFATRGPLPGVPGSDNGTVTAPSGSPGGTASVNVYSYESGDPGAWRYVTTLPSLGGADAVAACAATGSRPADALDPDSDGTLAVTERANCFRGTADGRFVTFWTDAALTADDVVASTGDVYGYDAVSDRLVRLSRPQGGDGEAYVCVTYGAAAGALCHGDGGAPGSTWLNILGVATDPADGRASAFFQSRSRLVPGDRDDAYDVYQWSQGRLTLVTGAAGADHALFMGNDRTGRNVYFSSRDRYSWQDHDVVGDVYTARIGAGIPEPGVPVICTVLTGDCQGGGFGSVSADAKTSSPGSPSEGNASSEARKTLAVSALSKEARRKASLTGLLPVKVRSTGAGVVRLTARGKVGKKMRRVGGSSKRLSKPGTTTVRIKLDRVARDQLRRGRKLQLSVQVRSSGARPQSVNVLLWRASR